jgi:hypothetical protein
MHVEGEPSATDDGDGGYTFLLQAENLIVENFSYDCVEKRIKIAEIPVGAVDSDLGTVYEYHVSYGDGSDNRCRIHSWDDSGWVIDSETEGIGAFSACYDIINAFKFYD